MHTCSHYYTTYAPRTPLQETQNTRTSVQQHNFKDGQPQISFFKLYVLQKWLHWNAQHAFAFDNTNLNNVLQHIDAIRYIHSILYILPWQTPPLINLLRSPGQPLASMMTSTTTQALTANGNGPSSSILTSTCHHIWSDKDVAMTPASASSNSNGSCSRPQLELSLIMTIMQFVSCITLSLCALVSICFIRLMVNAILVWPFLQPSHLLSTRVCRIMIRASIYQS